jgi:predicted alpha/beta-fold hydrolase
VPVTNSSFTPAWWLPGGHAQTLWGALLRPAPRPTLRRQQLELPDGDFLELDWSPLAADPDRPLVVLLHGLEGSSRSGYARGLLACLQRRGLGAVMMHFRGCGSRNNRLRRTYHAGETSDLGLLLRWLAHHWPRRSLGAAGFSLGGNVLLKLLQEPGPSALQAAAVACVPMDLAVCARRMERGFSRFYLHRLLGQLKATMASKYRHRPADGIDLRAVAATRGFWDFDDLATAPLHGFRDAHHYYTQASSRDQIGAITTPTLVVHARDDPFMTDEVLPDPETVPATVTVEVARSGGHMGFMSAHGPLGLRPRAWLERRLADFLLQQLLQQEP